MLDSKGLAELYEIFRSNNIWNKWHRTYVADILYFKGLSDEDFASTENQERLWRARGVSTLGPGESVKVAGAYSDPDIADLFSQVRHLAVPQEVHKRAAAIADFDGRIMTYVVQRHASQRPLAKLRRAFTVLLPDELHTCYKRAARLNVQEILFGPNNFSFMEGAVLVRDLIRKWLGKEDSLEESVWRSMFCWWLHENHLAIRNGDFAVLRNASGPSSVEEPELRPALTLWSPTKQRKGMTAISRYLEAFRMVVSAARGGASPDDIVTTIKTDPAASNYAPSTCRSLFNLVRNFGLIEYREGLWYPSADGEELVEDDPPDVLVEKLLVQVFGFAHFLSYLLSHGTASRRDIFDYLMKVYPAWTRDFAPGSLLLWLKSLGMVEVDTVSNVILTEYGRDWAVRLPKELTAPEAVAAPEDADTAEEVSGIFQGLPVQTVRAGLDEEFVFEPDQVEALHYAWHCNPKKRFVILSGLSGTGKTAMLAQYAKAYCNAMALPPGSHIAIVPVSPDWRDPSGIFGYFNALHADPTFQAEPALRLILDAVKFPEHPFFLLLDEMNLAKVERYFAPFLSSMETGYPLLLHAHEEAVNEVPPKVPWPTNLFIGGTVNMDETTHAFSDKVLDRAFTLEFWKVDLPAFFAKRRNGGKPSFPDVEKLMIRTNESLFRIRRHFGYRTSGEVLDFIAAAGVDREDGPFWRLADQAFFSKILPRLRGEQSTVMNQVLQELQKAFTEHGMERCQAKLDAMRENLDATGVTRFWA